MSLSPAPIPTTNPTPTDPNKVDPTLMEKISNIAKQLGGGLSAIAPPSAPQPGVMTQGRVGGPPAQVAQSAPSVSPSQQTNGVPGLPAAPQGGTGLGVSKAAMEHQYESVPTPSPTMTGFDFGSRAARTGAVAFGAIKNITDVVNKYKKQKDNQLAARAKYLTERLTVAIDRGDAETVNMILGGDEGPKNIKLLEKYGVGVPVELKKPEQAQGSRWIIAAQQSQAQQAQQSAAQAAALASSQQVANMQAPGPQGEAARNAGVSGRMLTAEEERKAASYDAGFEMSPVMSKQFDANQKLADREFMTTLYKSAVQEKQFSDELAARITAEKNDTEQSKLSREAQIKQWGIANNLDKLRLSFEEKRLKAVDKKEMNDAYKAMADGYTSQLNNIDDALVELEKAGKGDSELALAYQGLRKSTAQKFEKAKQFIDLSIVNDEVNKLYDLAK